MRTIETGAAGLTIIGALTGITTDNGFQTGLRMLDTARTHGIPAIFGQHDVATMTYGRFPDVPAGLHHTLVDNFSLGEKFIGGLELAGAIGGLILVDIFAQ